MRKRDPGQRVRAQRKTRYPGIWVYVDTGSLERAGIDPRGPAPYYRTWGRPGGSLLVRLYREP